MAASKLRIISNSAYGICHEKTRVRELTMFQNLSKATTKPEHTPLSPLKVLMWTLTLILSWTHRYSSPNGLPRHTENTWQMTQITKEEFTWNTKRFLTKKTSERAQVTARFEMHTRFVETHKGWWFAIGFSISTFQPVWTVMLDNAFNHHLSHNKWGNIFWKECSFLQQTFSEKSYVTELRRYLTSC